MSFYDLTKDGVLRPEDLFKYRLKRDSSIPSRGGQKEFEPDGSWLQRKCLESFLQEKSEILSEPRVEKLKNVVEGTWDGDRRLVNLKKPGKFWIYMGFADDRRNWLYPEEALFLMETNTLELLYHGRPMSIQEAYVKLLGRDICLEEYQVFSHLRRLGYVVLRHEEERIFTDYERKINLHEYIDKKTIKERVQKGKGKSNKKISQNNAASDIEKEFKDSLKMKDTITHSSNDHIVETSKDNAAGNLNDSLAASANSSNLCSERNSEKEAQLDDVPSKRQKLTCENGGASSEGSDSSSSTSDSSFYNVSSWSSCFIKRSPDCRTVITGEQNHQQQQHLNHTVMDSDSLSLFPDIAQSVLSALKSPPLHLLPSNLEITDLDVDCSSVELKSSSLNRLGGTAHLKDGSKEKTFSCLNGMGKEPKISSSSWSEYKRKKSERQAQTSSTSLVDHLWKDTVTPLMHPAEVTSYQDVMDRLQIIKSADPEELIPDVSELTYLPKVCFDVHLPDHRFKKTMPGIADHRVCVTRSDGVPPGLNAIQHFCNKFKDDVPLHWAVVDAGEIAFYVFDSSRAIEVLAVY